MKLSKKQWGILVIVALLIWGGKNLFFKGDHTGDATHTTHTNEQGEIDFWTCSMHPQIKMPTNESKCPLCAMDLIPVKKENTSDDGSLSAYEIKLSSRAMKLANVQTEKVKRHYVDVEVPLIGKIDFDETRFKTITSRVPGRIDRLFVDYTGINVRKNDHMVELYSPELLVAQNELLDAYRRSKGSSSSRLLQAAREKLRLWGVTASQVRRLESNGRITDQLTIYAPLGGVVIKKHVSEGDYVKTGQKIYTIADLSNLWVVLDAYESDIQKLRVGQKVEFKTVAYPGESFSGRISFISPILDKQSRTVQVRVNIKNNDQKLKPEMLVKATVKVIMGEQGIVADDHLKGKWIGPMHPEVVKTRPGNCDICGMPLVKAEDLGYGSNTKITQPLVIPLSAPLLTGKRAIVYVAHPSKDGVFESREIVLGARAGKFYLVKRGLIEGETVVTNGAFKIDSAMQIIAGPSMMNGASAETESPKPTIQKEEHVTKVIVPNDHNKKLVVPTRFIAQLDGLYSSYLSIQKGLSEDNLKQAKKALKGLEGELKIVDMALLSDSDAHMAWMTQLSDINNSVKRLKGQRKIKGFRDEFLNFSTTMIHLSSTFGTSATLFVYNCPMANNNKGGQWLQNEKGTKNPFYGAQMLKCGSLVKEIK
jgi:membrane fusion protein, copper/silver efflux system